MLDLSTQTAILRLRQEGHGTRSIARALGISRGSVLRVLEAGVAAIPRREREASLDASEDRVRDLFVRCRGNLVRVPEELAAEGASVSYPTVTRSCRTLGLGQSPKVVIASGTGKAAVAAPALEALGRRFGYSFLAHELGDANRSSRVEGPFWHVENNFYAGRTFASWEDCNT